MTDGAADSGSPCGSCASALQEQSGATDAWTPRLVSRAICDSRSVLFPKGTVQLHSATSSSMGLRESPWYILTSGVIPSQGTCRQCVIMWLGTLRDSVRGIAQWEELGFGVRPGSDPVGPMSLDKLVHLPKYLSLPLLGEKSDLVPRAVRGGHGHEDFESWGSVFTCWLWIRLEYKHPQRKGTLLPAP